jgi:hypothetical protein
MAGKMPALLAALLAMAGKMPALLAALLAMGGKMPALLAALLKGGAVRSNETLILFYYTSNITPLYSSRSRGAAERSPGPRADALVRPYCMNRRYVSRPQGRRIGEMLAIDTGRMTWQE